MGRGDCAQFSFYLPLHSNINFQRDKHPGLILSTDTNTNQIALQYFGGVNFIKGCKPRIIGTLVKNNSGMPDCPCWLSRNLSQVCQGSNQYVI